MNGMNQVPSATTAQNPLLTDWTGPFGLPPLPAIKPEHFRPAFDAALGGAPRRDRRDSRRHGGGQFRQYHRGTGEERARPRPGLQRVFRAKAGADTSDEIEAVERDISPLLARHSNAMYLDRALYARIADLYARRDTLGLDAEQARVLDRYHTRFVRAGGALGQGSARSSGGNQ